jgi:hypothetical protein
MIVVIIRNIKKYYMKKNIVLIIILFCFTSFCQLIYAQTTLEEYNYVTKGYKVQSESGLDMKKGYEFEDLDKVSTKIATAEMKCLYRVKDNKKEIAAYLIIYKRESRDAEYICVPSPKSDDEIMRKYFSVLWDGFSETSSRGQLIAYIISKQLK